MVPCRTDGLAATLVASEWSKPGIGRGYERLSGKPALSNPSR